MRLKNCILIGSSFSCLFRHGKKLNWGKSWTEFNFFPWQNGQENVPVKKCDEQSAHAHVIIFPFSFPWPKGQVEIQL